MKQFPIDIHNKIARKLEGAARTYVQMSDDLAKAAIMVAAVRDPARYGDAAEGVRLGTLVPHISVRAGVVTVSLVSSLTGDCVSTPFQFSPPPAVRPEHGKKNHGPRVR